MTIVFNFHHTIQNFDLFILKQQVIVLNKYIKQSSYT